MDKTGAFKFTSDIARTNENAKAIQRLVLQDVNTAGFLNPTELANPEDDKKVGAQIEKLTKHPENYCGYQNKNGSLVAFMKTGEWLTDDELPFVKSKIGRIALKTTRALRSDSLNPKQFGVFGLVVDYSLEKETRNELLRDLLNRSIGKAVLHSMNLVNIVIHDKDPLLPIANEVGFRPIGPKGIATGAPGLIQQRYQYEVKK